MTDAALDLFEEENEKLVRERDQVAEQIARLEIGLLEHEDELAEANHQLRQARAEMARAHTRAQQLEGRLNALASLSRLPDTIAEAVNR